MTQTDDGGRAFPQCYRVPGHSTIVGESGMSLRDWFAGQAMVAMLTPQNVDLFAKEVGDKQALRCITVACYKSADAMLAARKVTP